MFRHLLVPVDCSEESRRLTECLKQFAAPPTPCKIMLVASMASTEDHDLRDTRRHHAEAALYTVHTVLLQAGIDAQLQVLQDDDPIAALAGESACVTEAYDAIVLGTHHTWIEDAESIGYGSFADRLCKRTHLPVVILPSWRTIDY